MSDVAGLFEGLRKAFDDFCAVAKEATKPSVKDFIHYAERFSAHLAETFETTVTALLPEGKCSEEEIAAYFVAALRGFLETFETTSREFFVVGYLRRLREHFLPVEIGGQIVEKRWNFPALYRGIAEEIAFLNEQKEARAKIRKEAGILSQDAAFLNDRGNIRNCKQLAKRSLWEEGTRIYEDLAAKCAEHCGVAPQEREPIFSVVIAHRGPLIGLWATIVSCQQDFRRSGIDDYEIIVVENGNPLDSEMILCSKYVQNCVWIHEPNPLSPPAARNVGAAKARGKYLCFLDNHVMVDPQFFGRARRMLDAGLMDVLHSASHATFDFHKSAHYSVDAEILSREFWTAGNKLPARDEPYRCVMGNHGAFFVTRSVWEEVRGYWPGFEGWGGEESYFDLKMWMMGKSVWLDPQIVHHHFFADRAYLRRHSDDYYRNMMMAANIIGGQSWLDKVTRSFETYPRLVPRGQTMRAMSDLAVEAYDRSKEHAAWLRSVRKESLEDWLENMHARGIQN